MGKTESEKLRTISRDVCGEIRASSKRECEEINSISKKVCDEIGDMSIDVCKEIKRHAKPRVYDWLSFVVSALSIACSIAAIIVAIDIPNKIAEQQNKIALFEKRYEVYCEIRTVKEFIDEYYDLCTRDSITVVEGDKYVHLWEDKIHINHYSSIENKGTIIKLQEQKIRSIDFIFEDITGEESALVKDFFDMYYSYTQNFIKEPDKEVDEPSIDDVKETEIIEIEVLLNDSVRDSVMNRISMLMEKMEEQLSLCE